MPKQEPQAENETWRQSIPKPKKKPPLWKRLVNWIIFPLSITQAPRIRNQDENHEEEDESTELNAIMAETDQEDEEFFW